MPPPPGNDDSGSGQQDSGNDAAARDAQADARTERDTAPPCKTACAEDDCGQVPTGCDTFLDCAGCGSGLICGLSAPNKCDAPPPVACTPKLPGEVCTGKCGAVSDGCSNVIICDGSNGGVTCGANQACQDSTCTDTISPCVPQKCSDKKHECGQDGDGCGGVLSCGDCETGKVCNFASTGNTCQMPPPPACTPVGIATACTGTCGKVGDGCGGTYDCESSPMTACPQGQTCGGAGVPGQCGSGATVCQPLAASVVCANKCGTQSDGCVGSITCNASNGGQVCDPSKGESCGGGGVASQCGAPPCMPKTTEQLCPTATGTNKSCGKQPDGCGNLVDCGGCATGQQCGLTTASVCGTIPVCQKTPVATACAGKCGSVPDGCGGSYTCDGSNGGVTCSGTQYCGAGGTANTCGDPPVTCVPKTCAQLGHQCGLSSDGCGHVINCWPSCNVNNSSCSGQCTGSASCLANQNTGAQSCVSGGPTCTGSLCSSVPASCPAGTTTKLTGVVVTPGRTVTISGKATLVNQLKVPNAIVYIPAEPSSMLPSFIEGVQPGNNASCGRCTDDKLVADGQSVLAAAVTNFKGEFTLEGRIPVGQAFKLVVKIGKWRRVVQIANNVAQACSSVALPTESTRLNRDSNDGLTPDTHLPKIAVATGDVDAMECVLYGMGIAQNEFTLPTGTGRVHMYRANGSQMPGATCNGKVNNGFTNCSAYNNDGCVNNRTGCAWSNQDTLLYANATAMNAYDLVVFDCEGSTHYKRNATQRGYLYDYANQGGRVFASHWAYEWLDGTGSGTGAFTNAAVSWSNGGNNDNNTSDTSYVSLPTGATQRAGANPVKSYLYRDWLDYHGALTGSTDGVVTTPTNPRMTVTDPRRVGGTGVGTSTDEWMYRDVGKYVQQLSFNTPYAASATNICGRVAFTAFHVASSSSSSTLATRSLQWPNECKAQALTAQEKTLAFMLFDLASCVSPGDPPQPPACVPKTVANTCPSDNDACGAVSDGCGGIVDCGGCASGYYCDGNTCKPQQCTPSTCASMGYTCGNFPDGCGGIARNSAGQEGCGTCTNGQTCGFSQTGICGGCVQIPMGTACPSGSCGSVSDGCGATYDCGNCPAGQACGGGGPNTCGPGTCTPINQTTACQNKNCGVVADGCGGTYNCGTCTSPDTCGGGGTPNVCGHPVCRPKTISQACSGLQCGWVSDGCGGAINCGTCANGGVCGGNGANQCGASCTPTTCTAANANCGTIADGCGSLLNCGTCPSGQVCGATTPNQCAPGTTCTPRSCTAAMAECGLVGDGCGNVLDCGPCSAPLTCGGAGVSNKCGTGTGGCNQLTCGGQNVSCGQASDGCGGLLDCGNCPTGRYCQNGKCEAVPI